MLAAGIVDSTNGLGFRISDFWVQNRAMTVSSSFCFFCFFFSQIEVERKRRQYLSANAGYLETGSDLGHTEFANQPEARSNS